MEWWVKKVSFFLTLHSTTPRLHSSITPCSYIPLLHHRITPLLHYSISPVLHDSITPCSYIPLLHHSITPMLHSFFLDHIRLFQAKEILLAQSDFGIDFLIVFSNEGRTPPEVTSH